MNLHLALGTAPCCTCDPEQCADDDTGEHCATRSCGWCLHGCPAPDDEPCCTDGPSIVHAASIVLRNDSTETP